MTETILDRVRVWLRSEGVALREVHHEPTYTSEQSAAARGENIRIGGKALLLKVGEVFRLFVLSAILKLDSDAVKARFGAKRVRFASADELKERTELVPGSVPPFGRPILDLDLYVDESIAANEKIAFNAGSLTDSIVMSVADYRRVCGGVFFKFGIPPESNAGM